MNKLIRLGFTYWIIFFLIARGLMKSVDWDTGQIEKPALAAVYAFTLLLMLFFGWKKRRDKQEG